MSASTYGDDNIYAGGIYNLIAGTYKHTSASIDGSITLSGAAGSYKYHAKSGTFKASQDCTVYYAGYNSHGVKELVAGQSVAINGQQVGIATILK